MVGNRRLFLFLSCDGRVWRATRIFVVLLVLGVASAPAQTPVPHEVRPNAFPCLNVREEPNADATAFECLAPGTQVEVLEAVPYWRRIRLADGREGWSAKKFLEPLDAPPPADATALTQIPEDAWLEIHFVDVGQGDGIWIHTHDDGIDGNGIFEGRSIVVDGGPDKSASSNAMRGYLESIAHHGAVIDALIVTHPHTDHYRGAHGLLPHFEVRRYYDPGFDKGGTFYPAFLADLELETASAEPTVLMIGRDNFAPFDWGAEVSAEVLYSYPGEDADDDLGAENTLENNASIVIRVEYGDHVFLLMGDAEGKDRDNPPDSARYVEKVLLETIPAERLKATVLKVGHHGSETSSTRPFIEAVDPEIVVVSSGRSSFGGTFIPDATTLARYCAHNPDVQIYRTDFADAEEGHTASTDADGDHVIIRSNGTTLEVESFSAGAPAPTPSC